MKFNMWLSVEKPKGHLEGIIEVESEIELYDLITTGKIDTMLELILDDEE